MNELNISNGQALDAGPIIGIVIFSLLIFFLVHYVYMSVCYYKIAKKTSTPDAWFAWIPILDMLLALQIAKKPTWWIIWFFIPLANIIAYILVWMGISKTLGKQEWLGVLMIVSPINLIIPGYLAFSETAKLPTIQTTQAPPRIV
ncbi:MAG: DUF5684 domain-containing protein [Candidatus Moraniibacteriota bacterium]